jgi:hypothetical protein
VEQIAPGILRWTVPHPEWRTRIEWGHEVACYALAHRDELVLVDPLLYAEDDARAAGLVAALDGFVNEARRLDIMITIPYHARSAEPLFWRYRTRLETRIWGHPVVAKRFARETPLTIIDPAQPVGRDARAFVIGNPRRNEMPLYFPQHKALAVGDAIIGIDGTLRVWEWEKRKPGWYEDRFLPTLQPLLDFDVRHVLVTHGPAAVGDGRAALAAALAAPGWNVS